MDAIGRATQKFMREGRKQTILVYGSAMLALKRNEGYGQKRLTGLMDSIYEAWKECANDQNRSAVKILEDETGICLSADGHDPDEILYLSDQQQIRNRELSEQEIVYMRLRQMKWLPANITAVLFTVMHRKYGYGADRLQRLLGQMNEIRETYRWKTSAVEKAVLEETGIKLVEYYERTD